MIELGPIYAPGQERQGCFLTASPTPCHGAGPNALSSGLSEPVWGVGARACPTASVTGTGWHQGDARPRQGLVQPRTGQELIRGYHSMHRARQGWGGCVHTGLLPPPLSFTSLPHSHGQNRVKEPLGAPPQLRFCNGETEAD